MWMEGEKRSGVRTTFFQLSVYARRTLSSTSKRKRPAGVFRKELERVEAEFS